MSHTAHTHKHCDFVLVLVSIVAILSICQTTPVKCAKFEAKLQKLINEDELLTIPQQPIAPTSQQHVPQQLFGKAAPVAAVASATTKHEHYNLYHSELKRLSYETIHRILRDENEPNYRKEVSELRYYQKRSLQPTAHTLVRRSAEATQNSSSSLALSGKQLTDYTAPANCNTLQQLDLSHNQLRVVNLSHCNALQQLDLSNNALVSLPQLLPAKNAALLQLNLNNNNIRSVSAPALPQLHALHLSANQISNLAALNLSRLSALESLDLSCNRISNLETAFFPERMHNLKHLNLANNELSSIYRSTFYNLLSLNTLILRNNFIREIDYETFLALPNLQYLDLSHNQLQAESIRALQGIPDLVSLSIAFNPAVGAAMQEFVASWSLKELDASGTGLCQIPAALAQSVRTLKLTHNWLKVINCGDLDSYPLLQYLDLSYSRIEDIEDDALGRLEILHTLFLDHNKLMKVPVSLPTTLEHLFLQNNEIMDIQVATFQGLRNLQTLDLSGNHLLLYLPALPLPKLLTLNLQGAGITGVSQAIVHTLPRLRDLLLEDNPIKCSDLLGIAEWASPCRERVALSSTSADSNADDGTIAIDAKAQHHGADIGQQQEQLHDEWMAQTVSSTAAATTTTVVATTTNTKIDLKQKFLQEHNFFANFKSNCGKTTRQMLTKITAAGAAELLLMQQPNCALEFQEESATGSAGNEETASTAVSAKNDKSKVISQFALAGDKTKVQKKYAAGTGTNMTATATTANNNTATTLTKNSSDVSFRKMPAKAAKTLHKILQKKTMQQTTYYSTKQQRIPASAPALALTMATTQTLAAAEAQKTITTIATTNEANNNAKMPTALTHNATDADAGTTTTTKATTTATQQISFTTTMPKMTAAAAVTTTIPTTDVTTKIIPNTSPTSPNMAQAQLRGQPAHAMNAFNKILAQRMDANNLQFATKRMSLANHNAAAIDGPQTILTTRTTNNNISNNNNNKNSGNFANKILNEPTKQVRPKQQQQQPHSMQMHNMEKLNGKAIEQQDGNTKPISGQQQTIARTAVTGQKSSNDNADSVKDFLASETQRPDALPTTAKVMASATTSTAPEASSSLPPPLPTAAAATLQHQQQHKHEPLQLHIKDRHLIGTPLLMHKGENILVESERLRPLPTTLPSLTLQQHTASLAHVQPAIRTNDNAFQQKLDAANTQQAQAAIDDKPTSHGMNSLLLDSARTDAAQRHDTMFLPEHAKLQVVEKKRPSLTMKKMTVTTKHAAPAALPLLLAYTNNAANENEASANSRHNTKSRLNFKELKPEQQHTIASATTTMNVKHHNTVNTAITANQHELSTFAEHQQHAESLIKEPTAADAASETKTAQWLDMRKTQTTGHPGIVLLLSLSLFIVLLIGLMHVYRCDMPWRRHLPQQRPHHQRQCNDDDAHSFLSYQKWHHSARLEQPYNSPLHSLHVRELQKSNNLNADKQQLPRHATTNAKYPAAQLLANAAGAASDSCSSTSSGSNTSSHSSGLNVALAITAAPHDNDAYFIEMPTASAHLQNNLHSDLLPMELLHMSTAHTKAMADDNSSAIQTTPVSCQLNAAAPPPEATIAAATTRAAALNMSESLGVKLSPTTRKFSIW